MNLHLDESLVKGYCSGPQRARVLTESWAERNMFCPRCGNKHIIHFRNNMPVADFYCSKCGNQFELKSKNGRFGAKVKGGAYETMIKRITGNENPDFLFMCYSQNTMTVKDLIMIPKYFFVPEIIERRPPLANSARRAGWVGCNILIEKIPEQGKIEIVRDGQEEDREKILKKVHMSQGLKTDNLDVRGWLMDVLNCVNRVPSDVFTLEEMYVFEEELFEKHPENNNIRPKIRQQLQLLRDKGFISFSGSGTYRKVKL